MELLTYDSQTVDTRCSDTIATLLQVMADKYTDKKLLIALSGGNSPKKLLTALSHNDTVISFAERLVLVQVDDRVVSPTHKDSNQNMIKQSCERLLSYGATFFPIPVEASDAAEQYQHTMVSLLDVPQQYVGAIALLGMGGDGHTASIFPQTKEHVSPSSARYVFMSDTAHVGYVRISLTFHALFAFQHAFFYVPGEDKREMIKNVLDPNTTVLYPAAHVIHTHPQCTLCTTVSV